MEHQPSPGRKYWPGLFAAAALAAAAAWLGDGVPWLGGAGLGILSGVVIAGLVPPPPALRPGLAAAGKQVLRLAVILLGAGLDLTAAWRTGLETLGPMLATITAVFAAAYPLARLMGVRGGSRDLIAAGTAICGGSAIAAVAPIIGARDEEISYSLSVVFLFNLAAVLLFPWLGHAFGLTPEAFGVWAGSAVNDTSSVMAAAFAYHADAAPVATLVKMTRTVMIVPVALIFSLAAARRAGQASGPGGGAFSLSKVFPWFVLGFVLMSAGATWGALPAEWAACCGKSGKFLIVVALSGIGLNTDIRGMLAAGIRPILLGACLWFVVASLALAMLR